MGTTTISCSDETKDRFDDLRPDDVRSADDFLRMLLDEWDAGESDIPDADDISIPSSVRENSTETLDFDDVRNACATAIREELDGVRR